MKIDRHLTDFQRRRIERNENIIQDFGKLRERGLGVVVACQELSVVYDLGWRAIYNICKNAE